MAKPDDVVDDAMRRLAGFVGRDERIRLELELRQVHGGKSYYVKVDPATIAARRQKASGVADPGRGRWVSSDDE